MGIDLKPCSIQVYSKWYKSNTAIRKSQVKSIPIIHAFMLVFSSVFDMVLYILSPASLLAFKISALDYA